MKTREHKKELQTVTITTTTCDKCKEEIKDKDYNAFKFEAGLRVGEYDGHTGDHYGEDYEIDLCENCAKELFFRILPKYGIKPNDVSF